MFVFFTMNLMKNTHHRGFTNLPPILLEPGGDVLVTSIVRTDWGDGWVGGWWVEGVRDDYDLICFPTLQQWWG